MRYFQFGCWETEWPSPGTGAYVTRLEGHIKIRFVHTNDNQMRQCSSDGSKAGDWASNTTRVQSDSDEIEATLA